jgi:hypothetical protein
MSSDLVLAWTTLVSSGAALIACGAELARRRRRAAGRPMTLFAGARGRRLPRARAAPQIPPFPATRTHPLPRAIDAGSFVGWPPPDAGALLSGDDNDVVTVRFGGLDGGVYVSRHTGPASSGSAAPAVSHLDESVTDLPGVQRLRSIDPPPPLVVELLPVDTPLHKPWIIPVVAPVDDADIRAEAGGEDPDPDDGGAAGILV